MIAGNIALSGAQFQAKRLAASAQNVATATVGVGAASAEGTAKARQAPVRVEGVSQTTGGVRGEVRPDPREIERRAAERSASERSASDRAASEQGPGELPSAFDRDPGVRIEEEIVRAREAKQLHAANLKVIRAEREMLGTLLDREV